MPLRDLTRCPHLSELRKEHVPLLASLRMWAVMRKMSWCPMGAVAERLGSQRAAAHFHLMLEEIGAAWPEPFCVSPPCSPRLSHDEATFVEMIAVASRGNRPAFDRLLSDLLPADERERLFVSASTLTNFVHG